LAAGFAAGITEALIVVTPFEVVKIRLQQQRGLTKELLRYKVLSLSTSMSAVTPEDLLSSQSPDLKILLTSTETAHVLRLLISILQCTDLPFSLWIAGVVSNRLTVWDLTEELERCRGRCMQRG
jgi:hypothetical protein